MESPTHKSTKFPTVKPETTLIFKPAKNVFEAISPKLEDHEEEIIYVHPSLPGISCNQIGILYFDESIYALVENTNGSYLRSSNDKNRSYGTKIRIVWECYKGRVYELPRSPHIYQINANVYDYTEDNLLLAKEADKKTQDLLNSRRKNFINESIVHLMKIEKRWTPLGFTPDELWTLMGLPFWLVGARRRHDGEKVKSQKRRKRIKKIFE